MNADYVHVRQVTEAVHDRLVEWARDTLVASGLDVVEVHSQFTPAGATASRVVLFPYRLGPEPKMAENAAGISLLDLPRDFGGVHFVPPLLAELGQALSEGLRPLVSSPGGRPLSNTPFPPLDTLPRPLAAWFQAQAPMADPWVAHSGGRSFARLPALWWHPGYTLTVRYIVVASDPGRGTTARTSAHAPLGMNALSVLTAAVQRERVVRVKVRPPPLPEGLHALAEAVAAAADGTRILAALAALGAEDTLEVAVMPVNDLTNQEFALLMQALQQPLQVALNLVVRLSLGGWSSLSPGTAPLLPELRPPRREEPP